MATMSPLKLAQMSSVRPGNSVVPTGLPESFALTRIRFVTDIQTVLAALTKPLTVAITKIAAGDSVARTRRPQRFALIPSAFVTENRIVLTAMTKIGQPVSKLIAATNSFVQTGPKVRLVSVSFH